MSFKFKARLRSKLFYLFMYLFQVALVAQSGAGIDVKDKKAIENEVAQFSAKVSQLYSYWNVYVEHRDNIREKFLHNSIVKLKGLTLDQVDQVFSKSDQYLDYLDRLKESVFTYVENDKYWGKIIDAKNKLSEIYSEIDIFENRTIVGLQEEGVGKVLLDRKRFLLDKLNRIQKLAIDLRNLKAVNEKRITRYKNLLEQLKSYAAEAQDTWEGPFNKPMSKTRLLWVAVEVKKEIVTLKRQILNILKTITDEAVREELLLMDEEQYVF